MAIRHVDRLKKIYIRVCISSSLNSVSIIDGEFSPLPLSMVLVAFVIRKTEKS